MPRQSVIAETLTGANGKQIGSGHHAITNFGDARLDHAEVLCGSFGHVDDAALDKGPRSLMRTTTDLPLRGLTTSTLVPNRSLRMGGCEFRRIHALARGGARGQGVPGGAATGFTGSAGGASRQKGKRRGEQQCKTAGLLKDVRVMSWSLMKQTPCSSNNKARQWTTASLFVAECCTAADQPLQVSSRHSAPRPSM
jgi:hypothetical protein